jgi:hypothetical protein
MTLFWQFFIIEYGEGLSDFSQLDTEEGAICR